MTTAYGGDTMPDPAMQPAPAPLSPMFIWTTLQAALQEGRHEVARELDKVNTRIDKLDEHGTRGVEGLRTAVVQLQRDVQDHEKAHDVARRDAEAGRRWLIGIVVGAITPLYPLIGYVIFKLARG